MYDNKLYYFYSFLCLLFLSSNFLKIDKEFFTDYRKIRSNPTQHEFLAKMVFREIEKDTKLYYLYLNFKLYT